METSLPDSSANASCIFKEFCSLTATELLLPPILTLPVGADTRPSVSALNSLSAVVGTPVPLHFEKDLWLLLHSPRPLLVVLVELLVDLPLNWIAHLMCMAGHRLAKSLLVHSSVVAHYHLGPSSVAVAGLLLSASDLLDKIWQYGSSWYI